MPNEPTPLEIECRAEKLYTEWFDSRNVPWSKVRYGICEILRDKARLQLIREAEVSVDA